MADLGVPDYNPSVDINYGRMASGALQQLGAQLREDIVAVQANRQVKNLGAQLGQLDPRSEQFPTQLAQVALSNPLGSLHPAGKLAIETLGSAHKQWQQQLLAEKRLSAPSFGGFGGDGILNRKTGGVLREPSEKTPTGAPIRSGAGGMLYNSQTGDVLREPTARASGARSVTGLTPTEAGFLSQYAQPTKALAEVEPVLQKAGLGLDSTWDENTTAWDQAIADGKLTRDDALRANHWLKEFRRAAKVGARGDVTPLYKNALGKLSVLETKAFAPVQPSAAVAPSAAIEGDLPSGEAIAGGLGLMGGTVDEKIAVVAPDGTPGRVPASQLAEALKSGYTRR